MTTVYRWQDAPEADFAVIGDPVAHSLSPNMHQAAYAALGLSYKYVAIKVPVGTVDRALERLAHLGYKGVNVTVPHKEAALAWLDDADPVCQRARACNTLKPKQRTGINTDAPGFAETLTEFAFPARPRALVLGAGGSSRAIMSALDQAGFRLAIYNRTRENAVRVITDLAVRADLLEHPDVAGFDLIVNTTSAQLDGEELHIDWTHAEPDAVAYDLTYQPNLTPFLEPASRAGLRCVDGKPLLVAQGALAFEWWLGTPAPREVMAKALTR
jgi:shikimate dehydrogenase